MNDNKKIFVHEPLQRTVVVVDLVRYSDIVKSLQLGQKFGANATLLLNNQIQSLIQQSLKACGATPDCFVKSTGDGAILQFESPTVAEHFAATLHHLSFDQHCASATNPYEWRSFRVGICTGEVVLGPNEIAGAIVGFATRLESAAEAGEIVIETNSWVQLTSERQTLYRAEEVLKVKPHDPIFAVRRRRVVAPPPWEHELPSVQRPGYLNKVLNWSFGPWKRTKRWWIAVGAILLLSVAVAGIVAFRHQLNARAIEIAGRHAAEGDALSGKNQFGEAEVEYRSALRFDPNNANYYFKLARTIFYEAPNSSEVQTLLVRGETIARESIRTEPQNAAHHYALGLLLSEQSKYVEGEAAFREAIKLDPTNPEYRHDFAFFSLLPQDRVYEAEAQVREAIRLKPYFDYYDTLAQILEVSDNLVEAEVEVKRAISLNPVPYWVHEHLGTILFEQSKCSQAFEAYKEALSRYSKLAFSENGLGNVYFARSKYADAESKYLRAIELEPTYPIYFSNLGDLLSTVGRTDEAKSKYQLAEAAYRALIKRFPGDWRIHMNLGNYLSQRERYDEAKAEYESAIRLSPGQGRYHMILGDLLASQNGNDEAKFEYKKAESIYRQQIKEHPKEPGYHFDLGGALYSLGREADSRLEFETAAALSDESPSYYVILANFYYGRKDYANSVLYYQKVVDLRPDNAEYRGYLGRALYAMEEFEDAKSEHRRAHELDPEEAVHLNDLGDCYFRLQHIL